MENIFGVYKPKGPSSFSMIYQLRKIFNIKKIGHAGTLDPLADGVLVVAVGRDATKQLTGLIQKEKEYIATIKLGVTSTTDDEEGEKTEQVVGKQPTIDQIQAVLKEFLGEIDQVPPIFSALKIKGKPAYKYARAGKELKMEARKVLINEIELIKYSWPELVIRVDCGSGVYIRSLARDIGVKLGVGGYMSDLTRTRVGEFTLDKCRRLEELAKA
ncbi:MAG: tRNA pseudouridine synthase B [Parcubacteria group bacterium GW2011_GWC2_38_7]|nr:MAG: tRNA pseudouridine synthase B [Parcubacteria group bacterium GW2011_GWC2_38_7]